jgi:cytochrome P450 family 6
MTMFYLLFELSRNVEVQKRVHSEIDQILRQKSSGDLTFDCFNEMRYLDCCINETLRKYPSSILFRRCNKDYEVKGTDMVIEKGTILFIPTLGIHRDADIFENSLQFMPERFIDSANGHSNRKGLTFFPFGGGPRICIGIRLAKLQMKVGLALILSKFSVELYDKSLIEKEIEFDKDRITLHPKDSIKMKFVKRVVQ